MEGESNLRIIWYYYSLLINNTLLFRSIIVNMFIVYVKFYNFVFSLPGEN